MSDYLAGKAVRKIALGIKVDTAIDAVGTGANDIFEVIGGRVLMVDWIGEVTTEIQAAATVSRLRIGTTALSDTLDITGDTVGTLYGITGTVANDMYDTSGYRIAQAGALILDEGTVNFHNASGGSTGAIAFTMIYIPIDDGAYVEAI